MVRPERRLLLLLCLTLTLPACGETPATPAQASPESPPTLTIMTFNVQNLFDTTDDAGKDDSSYLPLSKKQTAAHRKGCAKIKVKKWRDACLYWDWNETVLEFKLRVLAESILQVGDGRGADIVALSEVENLSVLERLRTDYLSVAGYRPAILLEGDDMRGIDVAFLSRLESAGSPRLHQIPFSSDQRERIGDTRGILEATFQLPDGKLLTGYAVHFPAPFHPHAMREQAYEYLNSLQSRLPTGRAAFAAGDFNTPSNEERKHALLERLVRPHWLIAHETGCKPCKGTYYYAPKDDWSFLDMIFWARSGKGSQANWQIQSDSVHLANANPAQKKADGTPAAFHFRGPSGVSDHWPLVVTIESLFSE